MKFSLRKLRFVDTTYLEILTGRAYLANLSLRRWLTSLSPFPSVFIREIRVKKIRAS